MDKKKILIGVGLLAVIGIALYLYNKSKTSDSTEDTGNTDSTKSTTADATTPTADATTTTAKAPLEKRREKRQACGRKPLNKQKKEKWQKCVDAGGVVSFEGDFDEFEDDYMD